MGQPRGPLDAAAWDERYRSGDTPWDHGEPSPGLVDFLNSERCTPGPVLVPGCGAGHDCRELARHGFTVTGLDLSQQAIDRARALEDRGPPRPSIDYTRGDFLDLARPVCAPFDWLFEHTCFCAIHPDRRDEYVQSARVVLRPGGLLLGIFFVMPAEQGPPFGASRDELLERFGPHFELVKEQIPRSWPNRQREERLMLWRNRR